MSKDIVKNTSSTGYSDGKTSIVLYTPGDVWFHPLAVRCYSDVEATWKPLGHFQNYRNKRLKIWLDQKALDQKIKNENVAPHIFIVKNRLQKVCIYTLGSLTGAQSVPSPGLVSFQSLMLQMIVQERITNRHEDEFFKWHVLGGTVKV